MNKSFIKKLAKSLKEKREQVIKTVCDENDIFDFEKAFFIALAKFYDINKEYSCYSNNSEYYNIYPCSICGKNYYEDYSHKDDDNNYYIFCSEINKSYSSNESNDFTFILEYFSCKTCDKNGNQINKECLECETNYISELAKCENNIVFDNYYESSINNDTESN